MTEREFQRTVIATARHLGWRVAHFGAATVRSGRVLTPVLADGAGFPDLVLVRERIVYVELKSAKGRLSPRQREWMRALLEAGQEAYVWRASDWQDGTIESVLRAKAVAAA